MAVSAFKTYSAGEVLTASDLNASFSQIHDNGEDLGWPATQAKDMDGQRLQWDGDQDTYTEATGDDVLETTIGGVKSAQWVLDTAVDSAPDLAAYWNDASANAGPFLSTWRDSASPAANDQLGELRFYGEDDGGNKTNYASLKAKLITATGGSEDGQLSINIMEGGTDQERIRIRGDQDEVRIIGYDADANAGPTLSLRRNSASPADDDVCGRLRFDLEDSTGSQVQAAYIQMVAVDVTNATVNSQLDIYAMVGGTITRHGSFGESDEALTLFDTDAGTGEGPVLNLYRNSASPADSDILGAIHFEGEDDNGDRLSYARIRGRIEDASNGSEDGYLEFVAHRGGSDVVSLSPGILITSAAGTGTEVDFTVPANARKITVMFDQVSTNSTSAIRIELGDAGGIEQTGYTGSITRLEETPTTVVTRVTTSITCVSGNVAANDYSGQFVLTLMDAANDRWSWQGVMNNNDADISYISCGSKATSAELTTVRVTIDGVDVFDSGNISVLIE